VVVFGDGGCGVDVGFVGYYWYVGCVGDDYCVVDELFVGVWVGDCLELFEYVGYFVVMFIVFYVDDYVGIVLFCDLL